jgi:hypothetical protein
MSRQLSSAVKPIKRALENPTHSPAMREWMSNFLKAAEEYRKERKSKRSARSKG